MNEKNSGSNENGRNENEKGSEVSSDEYVFDFGKPKQSEDSAAEDKTGGYYKSPSLGASDQKRENPSGRYGNTGNFSENGTEKRRENGEPKKKKGAAGKILLCVAGAFFFAGAGFLGGYYSYDDELRSLKWVKQKIQNDYYYGDEITDEVFYDAVFDGVNGLLDPYSEYLSAEEFTDALVKATGKWIGIGLTFSVADEENRPQLFITNVSGNSPAEEAGITAGERIVGFGPVGGEIRDSVSYVEFTEFLSDYEENEKFVLRLQFGDEEPYTVEVAMRAFVENYVFYRSSSTGWIFTGEDATTLTEKPSAALSALNGDTAYIRLTQFNGNAAIQFAGAMDKFREEGKKNLVLDLRGNGGGYLDILCEVASYFCKGASGKPLVAVAEYRSGRQEQYVAPDNKYEQYFGADSRIKVLADNGTASASECLIGCMYDYGVIGYGDICLSYRSGEAKTYGKGIMQTTSPRVLFGTTDAVKLTTARILWPLSGNCIHGVGVLPSDGARTAEENWNGDEELIAALGALGF